MSNSTEHPRNGETYHAYYFGFDGTGTPIDKVLKAVATAGACYHHTEQWADDDGQICHMNQIQLAADEAAAELIAFRSLVGELAEGLAGVQNALNKAYQSHMAEVQGSDRTVYRLENEIREYRDHVKTLIARAKEAIK